MDEYIKREALLESIKEEYCLPCKGAGNDYNGCMCVACWLADMHCDTVRLLERIPAADVVPVVHGRWKASSVLLECQNCGEIYSRLGGNGGKAWNYCPNCGARMDYKE